jgi:hypothetical protein
MRPSDVQPVQPKEIDMGICIGKVSIREAVENVCAGLVGVAILLFVTGGTVAMCLPGFVSMA